MSKLAEFLENQQENPNSALNNWLNGKPIATTDVGMDTSTIVKLTVSLLVLGVTLMVIYKYAIKSN